MNNQSDKVIGCILGGALGDCLGGPYEGSRASLGIDDRNEWRLSDDTQMTLATCEAISKNLRVDPAVIAETFVIWFKLSRITGMGAATYKALSELSRGGHWALVGRRGEMAAGNGAAMRIAPLAFWLDPKGREERVLIRDVSRITHHNEEAYAGALAVALAVRAAFDGTWTQGTNLVDSVIANLPDTSVRDRLVEIARIREGTTVRDAAQRFGCSGYAVESVPLALHAAQSVHELGFEGMLKQIASAGGDTDTVGSMAGQIAGTVLGHAGLPTHMLDRLPKSQMIDEIVKAFSAAVAIKAAEQRIRPGPTIDV